MDTIGTLVKHSREARGMTQQQLADSMGQSRVTVANWERGKYRPSPDNLRTLAALLEWDAATLGAAMVAS